MLQLISRLKQRGVITIIDGAHGPGQVESEILSEVIDQSDFFVGNLLS